MDKRFCKFFIILILGLKIFYVIFSVNDPILPYFWAVSFEVIPSYFQHLWIDGLVEVGLDVVDVVVVAVALQVEPGAAVVVVVVVVLVVAAPCLVALQVVVLGAAALPAD